jgi:portal protein
MALMDLFKRRAGRRRNEPARDTQPYPGLYQYNRNGANARPILKPTPRNLRYFSRTPYARRAINAIKSPIAMLGWEIVPLEGIDLNPELERQIEVATTCLASPNNDDSFRTLIEQVVEDYLVGAGAIEIQLGGDPIRPLWLWPVDGLSIQIYPGWDGDPASARYAQVIGDYRLGGGATTPLRNDELIYIRPNPTTASPFGVGPLEIAFNSISRILGVGEFAGNVASNARPSIGVNFDGADSKFVQAFRAYWTNEVEGQGKVPITGMSGGKDKSAGGMEVVRFYPEGDDGLYLKYQEFLKSEIAVAFDVSPQNLGVERDVNRNTAEVAEDRDWDGAIKPAASLIGSHLTREAIQGRLGFSQLRFCFTGLDREDEQASAEIYQTYYLNNAVTANEQREKLGKPPTDSQWGDMFKADVDVAIAAARGAAEVDDPKLTGGKKQPAKPKGK